MKARLNAGFFVGGNEMANSAVDIRTLRENRRLSRRQVAEALGRSHEWLRLFEVAQRPLTNQIRDAVIRAIERLTSLRATESEEKQKIVSDLALPRQLRAKQ
ncbi:MAG TPA: helix-turn-helix transcriptional regulator [Candidatus Acidoferrum sp.]|jgi:hypothetical protein